jgi:hypothetical protein
LRQSYDRIEQANLVRRQADMALRHEPPEGGDFYISRRALSAAPSTVVTARCISVGHLYRRASALCACTLGPAAGPFREARLHCIRTAQAPRTRSETSVSVTLPA